MAHAQPCARVCVREAGPRASEIRQSSSGGRLGGLVLGQWCMRVSARPHINANCSVTCSDHEASFLFLCHEGVPSSPT